MGISEKIAYLKGLMEGMNVDTESNEGKLFAAVVDVLDEIALEVEDLTDEVMELGDGLDVISDDLSDVEDIVYDEWDDDDDDDDEHEHHHHHHDGECCCGHHHHHHDHDADEVFTSWGHETAHKYSHDELESILTTLDSGEYGAVLRAKGIVDGGDTWYEFDMVPGEHEIRTCGPDVTGKVCVIGSQLKEHEVEELFHA